MIFRSVHIFFRLNGEHNWFFDMMELQRIFIEKFAIKHVLSR